MDRDFLSQAHTETPILTLCIWWPNWPAINFEVKSLAITIIYYICDWVWENRSYRHNNWCPFFACTWKLHPCTTQKHQVLDHGWPGLLLQTAFYRCCQTIRVHFMALEGINRTAWGTRLLLTAVLASLVDSTSLCPILRAQHCCLSPNSCFSPPLASHPPLPPPHPL